MILQLHDIYSGYEKSNDIVKGVSIICNPGEITAIIGKNGCGKSTFLKAVARQLALSHGKITLDGADIKDFSQKQLAQKIAVLPQIRTLPSIPARALVMHGRFPYLSFPRIPSAKDREIVKSCMAETNTLEFADKDVATLSGGQRQRVYIAMLLAQQTDLLLLDAPTAFLDLNCQFETLDLLLSLKEKGKCIVVVLHDISQAMTIADKILLLDEGNQVFYGTPEQLANSQALQKYMNIVPHKTDLDGKTVYCFSRAENS